MSNESQSIISSLLSVMSVWTQSSVKVARSDCLYRSVWRRETQAQAGNLMPAYGFAKELEGANVTGRCLTETTLTFTVRMGSHSLTGRNTAEEEEVALADTEAIIKAGFCRWIL